VNRQFRRAARRRVALLGCLLILFQAILFGWHHHALALGSHGVPPAAHGEGGAPLSPATAEDDCDICQVLHHLRTAPGEILSLPLPAGAASALTFPELVRQGRGVRGAFQARAPPRI
jgi:DUF2946 family protein